jgi:uncharacterized membrane protein
MKKYFLIAAFIGLFFFVGISHPAFAQTASQDQPPTERFEAVVTKVSDAEQKELNGKKQLYQKLELLVTAGSLKGKTITVENGAIATTNIVAYKKGDSVMVTAEKTVDNKDLYYITDYVRNTSLYWLFGLFVALTVFIGRKRGILSLLGMGFSFLIIFTFVLPQISAGTDPVFVAILAAMVIIPVSFILSHGISKKTIAAMIGTYIALVITGMLAGFFVDFVRLTGFASDEVNYVQATTANTIDVKGLLLAGMIIGVLGILDDITITQAAVVAQLKKAMPEASFSEIYAKAMDVGRDHIASVVNTLILVYTGASLPLLLLFINNPIPFSQVINYEMLAEEIVRTLVGSIGLILAIPLTTFIADFLIHDRDALQTNLKHKKQK